MVRKAAMEINGAPGPSGMDANTWRMLLTSKRNSTAAADLCKAVAELAQKMGYESCQHLEALINCRLIPLKNQKNDVRPIGIGEVLRRIISKCIMKTAREDTMKAVGNLQLCAGQQAGAEAAVHAAKEIFADKECEAVLLVDASNAFNTLNRQAMMHNISVLCPTLATYVKNTYKVPPRLFVAKDVELRSEEGTTQGDPIAMGAYALGLSVLQSKISQNNTRAKHIAYADDLVGLGKLQEIKNLWDEICKHGPPLGYNPNAKKSCLIVKEEKKDQAMEIFKDTGIMITTEGQKHLRAVIGSPEFKSTFTKNLVDKWVLELQELSKIAKTEPHAAYSNFVFSFKMKWNYYMRTIPNLRDHLQPLEDIISNDFVPSLFGCKVKDLVRRLIALPPKLGGMGITNPTDIADNEYENSIRLTQNLTKMIINQDRFGSIDENEVNEIKKSIAKEREMKQKEQLKSILDSDDLTEMERKKIEICQEPGASNWLTALPLREAGFSLNKQEFKDALAIRYNISIKGLPETCACGSEFTCDHAMICKKGGFISLRHNDLRDITYELLSEVCKGVENEPMLQPLTGETLKYQTAKTENNARLDVSALGFWCRDQRAFFDIRVFDPVAPSHAHQSLDAAHSKQENEKRRQYEDRILHVEHASFTPLVFTIAGGMSKCTKKFFSRLGEMLAEKRLQPKSVISSWIRCRVSFSLLRSAARCLRGTRYRKETPSNIQHIDLQQQAFVGQLRGPTYKY